MSQLGGESGGWWLVDAIEIAYLPRITKGPGGLALSKLEQPGTASAMQIFQVAPFAVLWQVC